MSAGVIKVYFVDRRAHWYGKAITAIESFASGAGEEDKGIQFDHVAFEIDGWLYEAVQPELHKLQAWDFGCPFVTKEITVPDIEAAKKFAEDMVGKPYGLLTSCVLGGIHDIFDIELEVGDFDFSCDCSEYGLRTLRAGGLDELPGTPAGCVTPRDLYDAII